ncbi:hypothetical protein [Streptomyces sp. NPDC026673]|uniref:hypothetical protein n=1 Tax=Streptomyces sp. NPDC026673 TaxID=3155724 RepID=UPI0033FBA87F
MGAGIVGAVWGLSTFGEPDAPGTFTLTGTMTLTGDTVLADDGVRCVGSSGYDDIREGTGITVYDSAGRVIATGNLGAGDNSSLSCKFPVSVPGVPKGSKFYQVEISHRGKITVSSEEAEAGEFGASLG